jgi:DNA-directed RNA polymerase specialized sigma24 family protein
MGAYSNPSVVSRLQRLLAGQDADRASDRSSPFASRKRKQAQVRLTNDEIDVVIAGYRSGLDLNELSTAFGADRRTLANRLEQRGVPRRSRRLTDEQIQEAVILYTDGWSLARIARHLDVYPESVRYRLRESGVALRARPGS